MICIVYGTRPEFIKMAPLIKKFKERNIPIKVLSTGQHESMLDELYELFEIQPDEDLELWRKSSNLAELNGMLIPSLYNYFVTNVIKHIFVQGDTATTFCSAYAGFLNKSNIYHLEAGLRTYNKYSPWPEEINRKLVGTLADFHFCSTKSNLNALLKEGVENSKCEIVGNTVIDAVQSIAKIGVREELLDDFKESINMPYILVTGHRRENWGEGIMGMCAALKLISESLPGHQIIFCCHPNPAIREQINKNLEGHKNISLFGPQRYDIFIHLLKNSSLIISDSGGIQEEITALGRSMLITRDTTERQEAVDSGHAILCGTEPDSIYKHAIKIINEGAPMNKESPFGSGDTAQKIVDYFEKNLY